MTRKILLATGALICVGICFALARNMSPITGQWSISGRLDQGRVQLTIERHSAHSSMSNSSPVPASQLRGLSRAQLDSPSSVVGFELVRDAGTLGFEGRLANGNGGGSFAFSPRVDFPAEMRAPGFAALSSEMVFSMAIHDVNTGYVRQMTALGTHPESGEQLVTMRIHDVSPAYIRKVRSQMGTSPSIDQLVAFRIHGVMD